MLYPENQMCLTCARKPCDWTEFGDDILEQNQLMFGVEGSNSSNLSENLKRKQLYKAFTFIKFGSLGSGNRIPISKCVVDEIRLLHPDVVENYMGYQEN